MDRGIEAASKNLSDSVQDACLRLTRFWAEEGCLLLPAHDEPLVAGILHPHAFLSLVDPRPRSFVYVQPVRRPLDSRHGGHSFRLAQHLQMVTVLRPAPDAVTARFLASLRALGIGLEKHDVRFTEGRWTLPGAAAWGLGWNVRVDGVGVARITFIQGVAGQRPRPVGVEIAYGIERLLTCATGVASVYDVAWSAGGPVVGDLWRPHEESLARLAFEVADPDHLRARLAANAAEAEACLEAELPTAACAAAVRDLYLVDMLTARRALTGRERELIEARVALTLEMAASMVRDAAEDADGR